ncbi:MAG TPA: exonuclease SbcCD subunit D [Candidatus Thermoplasmatota archaeon]|nr:exonuclease SbcCD subunit D [Candidatus Thermoplasmatota archaeon]
MRVLHVSDTHIGYSAYSRLTEQGLNQREQDFFNTFREAIDVAIREKVDLVLHSGDVFDSVRPSNRAVSFAMEELTRLSRANIPFLTIAGNHEAPKLRETGSVLRFFEFIPGCQAVYKGRYEVVRFGDVAFHCVPHVMNQDEFLLELQKAAPDPSAKRNVLVLHGGVVGVADFRTGEFNELTIPASATEGPWDYVALGHYHKCVTVGPRAWYAGSTERSSFKEWEEPKGVLLVDLAKPDATPRFIPLAARPMVNLKPLQCSELAPLEIPSALHKRVSEAEAKGAIVRLVVRDIPRSVYGNLDFAALRKATEGAVHFHIQYEIAEENDAAPGSSHAIGGMAEEFETFVDVTPVAGVDKARLKERGLQFLAEATASTGGGEE